MNLPAVMTLREATIAPAMMGFMEMASIALVCMTGRKLISDLIIIINIIPKAAIIYIYTYLYMHIDTCRH